MRFLPAVPRDAARSLPVGPFSGAAPCHFCATRVQDETVLAIPFPG